jgi:hypothetical protein
MADTQGGIPILHKSALAAADLSSSQFLAVKLDGNEKLALCTTQGEKAIGILQDDPEADEIGAAMIQGLSKAKLGGTVTTMDYLTVNSSSKLIKATDGEHPVAIAFQDGVADDRIQVFVLPGASMSAAGSVGDIKYAEVAVTSAEILALNTTAKTLVAAPGAGYVLEFLSAVLILDYNSAAYATNGDLSVRENDASGTALSDTVALADFLAKTADTIQNVQVLSADTALLANKAMVLSCATGDPATGDSPVRVKVNYRIHETGL